LADIAAGRRNSLARREDLARAENGDKRNADRRQGAVRLTHESIRKDEHNDEYPHISAAALHPARTMPFAISMRGENEQGFDRRRIPASADAVARPNVAATVEGAEDVRIVVDVGELEGAIADVGVVEGIAGTGLGPQHRSTPSLSFFNTLERYGNR
jgi:hypothetical protein